MKTFFKKTIVLLRQTKSYVTYLILVFGMWSLVPALAKISGLNGMQKTFWVNFFAVCTLLALILILRLFGWKSIYSRMTFRDFGKISLLGIVFPFIFSLCYFQAIYEGSPSITAIIGRTSILLYVPISIYWVKSKSKFLWIDIVMMFIAVFAVAVALIGGVDWGVIKPISILLAIGAAVTNGIYLAWGGDGWRDKYDPLYMTLVIEAISTLLAGIFMFSNHLFVLPTGKTLLGLLYIGVVANGVAFWLHLNGLQRASRLSDRFHIVIYLTLTSGVLNFTQIILIAVLGAESVSTGTWIGGLIILFGLVWYTYKKQMMSKL